MTNSRDQDEGQQGDPNNDKCLAPGTFFYLFLGTILVTTMMNYRDQDEGWQRDPNDNEVSFFLFLYLTN